MDLPSRPAMTARMGARANSCAAFVDLPRRLERNPKVQEMTAGPVSLFPDCYLQWLVQLQRVGPVGALKFSSRRCGRRGHAAASAVV